MDPIQSNWERLNERVEDAARRSGRAADDVTIVAVTKTRSADEVVTALAAGVTDVGENRVQETQDKRPAVDGQARWHLIGQLQRNKAGKAVELFDVVQSVDSPRLADALDARARNAGRTLDILLQVNTSGATQQGGIEPRDVASLLEHVRRRDCLRPRGLMTIGAHSDDVEAIRACFRQLRTLADEHDLPVRSMGMSGDFEVAIEEGATLIRVGTVLFGERNR